MDFSGLFFFAPQDCSFLLFRVVRFCSLAGNGRSQLPHLVLCFKLVCVISACWLVAPVGLAVVAPNVGLKLPRAFPLLSHAKPNA